jgi:phosphoribosylformylglycinamidine synthase
MVVYVGLYRVGVVVTYRRELRDPEGETIRRDLLQRAGYDRVREVRAGKYLDLLVEAETLEEAVRYVREACTKLRIYNPVVHTLEVIPLG